MIITGRRKDAVEIAAAELDVTGFIADQSSLADIEALATAVAGRKIRVNAVSPGPVATEIMGKIGLSQSLEEHMICTIPLSRFGKAEEVAKLIAFL